jgi:hypothetical protein
MSDRDAALLADLYRRLDAVLTPILGSEAEDGAGLGLVEDVQLALAVVKRAAEAECDEARAQLAALEAERDDLAHEVTRVKGISGRLQGCEATIARVKALADEKAHHVLVTDLRAALGSEHDQQEEESR